MTVSSAMPAAMAGMGSTNQLTRLLHAGLLIVILI
jgi:hypothetical protein